MPRPLRRWILYEHPGRFLGGWRKTVSFVVVTFLLMVCADWIGENVLVEPAAAWYRDFHLRRLHKAQERFTRIVRIDDEDHERLFEGRSPLPGATIVRAACALASRGAAVVVVDLDTSKRRAFSEEFIPPKSSVPLVWAVDVATTAGGDGTVTRSADAVLGGRVAEQPTYGIAVMPRDFDGVVRRWRSAEFLDGAWRDTLPWRAVTAYCGTQKKCDAERVTESAADRAKHEEHGGRALTTDYVFQQIPLSDFIAPPPQPAPRPAARPALQAAPPVCEPSPQLAPDPRIEGRIVVLGGFYSREDLHDTPWGRRRGAELVAMAIEHVFEPAPSRTLATPAKIVFEICLALTIAFIHHRLRPIAATLITLLLLPIAVVLFGELLFRIGSYEVGIVVFGLGILIEQLANAAERSEELAAGHGP